MSGRTIETYIVDSFTNKPFKGNPAGVCLLDNDMSEDQMLSIAQELNLSETAYVRRIGPANNYSIRYFSPKMEIPLCGHATLAASKILFANTDIDEIHFKTIEALDLKIKAEGEGIVMEFPVYETEEAQATEALRKALGLSAIANTVFNADMKMLLLELESDQTLHHLTPDFNALVQSHSGINGVLVTAPSSDANYDFKSRYFWPWSGTNEDPVTGATHTLLTKYWSTRLNKTKMRSLQCSERTGFMEVELISPTKMTITGTAVVVLRGSLMI